MATIEPNFESICINPNDDLVLYKKEIVRSRIEKFLYAICSLDNDDLPTPLSRIEEMYKCLVMGVDFITFTPLSRAEKFVMAMLGAYDVELLPTPNSRSEILMKKIATGDNNLDDIDNLQSRYEFLLAYIIKAGGFNGGSGDFYYNLTSLTSSFTTIYGTLDKPVKNAVLKGQTLVNLVGTYKHTISTVNKPIVWGQKRLFLTNIKPNTRYTLRAKITEIVKGNYGPRVQIFFSTYSIGEINTTTSTSDTLIFTSPAELSSDAHLRLIVTGSEAEATEVDFEILLLEGEYPDIKDIPFFDDMASVKMPVLTTTGKNLFDINKFKGIGIDEQGYYIPLKFVDNSASKATLKLKPNTKYVVTGTYIYTGKARFNFRINDGAYQNMNDTFETDATGVVNIKIGSNNVDVSDPSKMEKIMIVETTLKDIYEPFKSNILTCNEEVELRGIGNIKDELNLLTGELTQRIQERVFDGSENWIIGGTDTNYIKFRCENYTDMVKSSDAITCDRYTYNKENNATSNLSVTNSTTTGKICIVTSQTDLSIDNFKAKLNTDKPTIQYQLAEPIVKTVDLSALDQDGIETELSTFDDITHVISSSEGLIPTGEIDIARPIQFVDYSLDNSLTTLYNTLEYPVKSAILKGRTLVNISSLTGVTALKPGDVIFLENTGMKKNTIYTIMFNCSTVPSTNFVEVRTMMDNTQITQVNQNVSAGYNKFTIKTNASKETNRFRFKNDASATTDFIFSELVILEGDYTNIDIPYFEGMASVKMPVLTTTGKNLFDVSRHGSLTPQPTGDIQLNSAEWGKHDVKYILKPNTQYTLTILGDGTKCWMAISVDGSSQSSNVEKSYTKTFSTNSNGEVTIGIYANSDKYVGYSRKSITIEEGTVSTPYEPHKSNILTCNEEVELRGIGEVKDELDLLTGEFTRRIGEIVLDGSENWQIDSDTNDYRLALTLKHNGEMLKYSQCICDKIRTETMKQGNTIYNYLYIGGSSINLYENPTMTLEGFKSKLKQNPITFQYQFTTESVKTVDLSTLDQDGKETKLSTFDDITHVTVSSEGLVPKGEITVATKNATDVIDASVMSLRMDDILNSQGTLEGSANTQSDDIDVAMLGTTDIYEQLL